jgi:cytochrome c oxidase assembly protein subunit 15
MTPSRKISNWLFICALSVFLMAIIGAVTRLTESGLSIVEWKPVTGALPPLNEQDWLVEFNLYQKSPQYKKINHGMTLPEFKKIFFWEWIHRLWGRLIGVLYALPLVFFWRKIPVERRGAFIGLLGLGFAQGAMGWYMVKSGLVDMPAVSHYRLAAHLMLAFLIYACLFRLGLSFRLAREAGAEKLQPLRAFIRATLGAAVLTMIWGAFVAGLDAGMVYNTFPMMNEHWFPPETMQHQPVWRAFFEDPATVQFTHRILAILTLIKVVALFMRSRRFDAPPRTRKLFIALAVITTAQVSLGIGTLISLVDIHLATLHQAGAMLLLSVLVWLLYEIPGKEKT